MALDTDKLYDLCFWLSKRRACETLVASIRREVVPLDVAEERVREFVEADLRYTELYAELYKDIVSQDPSGRPRVVRPRTEFAFMAMSTNRVGQERFKSLDDLATAWPGHRGEPVAVEIDGDLHEPRELNGDERELLKHKIATTRDQGAEPPVERSGNEAGT